VRGAILVRMALGLRFAWVARAG